MRDGWRRVLVPASGLVPLAAALGGLCFAAALGPGMIPRAGLLQGVLAGASFAAGYLVGFVAVLLWSLLGLRGLPDPWRQRVDTGLLLVMAVLVIWSLLRATAWQQDLHHRMGLPPVESVRPLTIALGAMVTATVLILVGRLFRLAVLAVQARLLPLMPPRLALLVGLVAAAALFNFIGNDIVLRQVLGVLDRTYARLDAALPPDQAAPVEPWRSGSAASLVRWEDLGAAGRDFVSDPMDAAGIAAITGTAAQEPVRVYVGLASADTPEARADLALREAIRTGAFDRRFLVIATPTGTGWVDPAGILPLEVLTGGDVATVSVQYSYLPSWMSLLTIPEYGRETARAVFRRLHEHWRSLPRDSRPELYLFGLSLGALNSDLSVDVFDIVGDAHAGALWVGPPFASRSWRRVTDERLPGTPEVLPRFRDGSVIHFMAQSEDPDADRPWGAMRIVYLQYASDPIVFFSPSILWRRPDWMAEPRAHDVTPALRWMPLVTFLQVGFDVITATTAPLGHGHVYDGAHYMNGWLALLPLNLAPGTTDRLLQEIHRRACAARIHGVSGCSEG